MANETDIYFKKLIPFKHYRKEMQFRVSQELFSSHQVDLGSRLLLRTLGDSNPEKVRKILDLGCGYGPIGLTLKKMDFMRTVHLVDRDALAVEYTRQNAKLNKLSNAVVYGSLGYDSVSDRDFDLIVSNIPGKAGDRAIQYMLGEAYYYLKPDGFVAVVVVNPLAEMVEEYLNTINAVILLKEEGSEHVVFHYHFPQGQHVKQTTQQTSLERGIYDRDKVSVSVGKRKVQITTAKGLPEYDTPSFDTQLLMKAISKLNVTRGSDALVLNPGQGHVPLAVLRRQAPGKLVLASRDLLSLAYAERNLVSNGFPPEYLVTHHDIGLVFEEKRPFSLITMTIPKSEGQFVSAWLLRQASSLLVSGGVLMAAGSSTAVTRLETIVRDEKLLTVQSRKKNKGRSILILGRK